MTLGTDEHTAPDPASGAVLLQQHAAFDDPSARLTERAFWRAVAATVAASIRPRRR